jgi:hypothetical protein
VASVKQDLAILLVARIQKIPVTAIITSRTVLREESVQRVSISIRSPENVKINALLDV